MSAYLKDQTEATRLQLLVLAIASNNNDAKDALIEELLVNGTTVDTMRCAIHTALGDELARDLDSGNTKRWNRRVRQAFDSGMCIQAIIEATTSRIFSPKTSPVALKTPQGRKNADDQAWPTSPLLIIPAGADAFPAPRTHVSRPNSRKSFEETERQLTIFFEDS